MQSDNRLFDDLSKLANGALGTLSGVGKEIEQLVKNRMEQFVGGLDMVRREEFDAVKAMADKARAENDVLAARLASLEAKLGDKL
jgi:BMFP domain-containing protein YqiC